MVIKKLLVLMLISALVLSFISGCGRGTKGEEEEKVISVETAKAKKGDIESYYGTSGEFIANEEVKLIPKMQGRVKKVYVDVGDHVKEGDLLLEIENDELIALVNKAKSNLSNAQANLDKAIRGARKQEREQARAGFEQAQAAFKNAEENYKRMKMLYDERAISKQQLDATELQYITAKNQLKSAQEQLSLIEEGTDQETIRALEAQVLAAKAALQQAQAQLDNSYLTSPISGTVAFRNIEPGEMAVLGSPAFTVADLSKLKVKFNIPEEVVGKIKLGDDVKFVVTSAGSQEFAGKITQISPMADFRYKAFPVEAFIENPSEILKPGMFVEVYIPLESKTNVLTIPKEALVEERGEKIVYTVKNNTAIKNKVKIGVEDAKNVEVIEGLSEGDTVVVEGQFNLNDGIKVTVKERGSAK
jgi:multidrug efflux pump subunit AcrA (membrane-fusion protein)